MLSKEVLDDYRRDWVERACGCESINRSILKERGVFLLADENGVFSQTVQQILTSMLVPINDAAISGDEVMLAFDMKSCPITDEQRTQLEDYSGRKLLVTDDRDRARESVPLMPVLYAPRVYGAGLENGENIHPHESTNIIELFPAALFLASRREPLIFAAYYAGHGGCTIKGTKDLTSGKYNRLISYEDGKKMLDFSNLYPDKQFYFDDTYGGQLGVLHERLFELLDEFDRICRKNDITYFLGGGTLLGAARYNDMIPWDDDMDVMMTREEYERFLSVVGDTINKDKFFFQSSLTDPQYHSIFTKIRLNDTKYVTRFSSSFKQMHQGIFIDIFVHDKTSDNKKIRKLHVFATLFARSLVFNKWAGRPMHFYGRHKLICAAATRIMNVCSMERLERFQRRVVTFFDKKNTHYLYDGTGEHLRHGGFPAVWLSESVDMKFGKKEYPVPKEYEKYLKYSYGDYKKPVSASLRKAGHDVVEFDTGK